MKPRLYLVDAHAYLHRAYHALPPLTNSKGEPVGALYGFARTLIQILRRDKPEAIAVCFDVPGPTFRDKMYKDYKATRKEIDGDLISQLRQARPLAETLGFKCIEKQGYEADDVMATMARKAVEHGWDAVLVTGDKDALQLVGKGIRVFNVSKNLWMDPPQIEEKFGIGPESVRDYLAIVGDSVDNVKGVKGVGPVGAVKLIKAYGSLKGAIAAAKKGDGGMTPKVAQALKDSEKEADLALALIALEEKVPLDAEPEDCRVSAPDPVKLGEGLAHFEFRALAKELGAAVPAAEPGAGLSVAAPAPAEGAPAAAETRPAEKVEFKAIAKELAKAADVVVCAVPDAAGEGELLTSSRVRVALGLEDGRIAVVDEAGARDKAAAAALSGKALKVGWDLKATRAALDRAGLELAGPDFDARLAAFCLDPASARDPKDSDAEAAALARAASCLGRESQFSRMRALKVLSLFEDVEMPLSAVLRDMERAGILVDEKYLKELSKEFLSTLAALQKEIDKLAGAPLNVQSPKQLGELLFDKLGLPVLHKTAKGGRSVDEETLQSLAGQHALPAKILEFREIAKLESTYVRGLLERLDPKTKRVHTTFDQTGALTGRLSSLDPNLQNIPVRTEAGRRIRRAFVAPKGKILLSADYSQIDLRVLAHESGDETLIASFKNGEDIHKRTAAEVFHVKPEDLTVDQRRAAKAINFGIVYGQTAFGLANQLGIPQGEAGAYIKRYLERYPGVSAWVEKNLTQAKKDGCVRTLLGRVRWIPELAVKNAAVRQFGERAARNTPIQGGSADIIKLAMLEVAKELAKGKRGAEMLLQVHDELVFEVDADQAAPFAAWVRGVMEKAVELRVPLVVDVKAGPNWQDMEKIPSAPAKAARPERLMTRVFRHDPMNFDALPISLKAIAGVSIGVYLLQLLGGMFPALDYHLVDTFGLVPALVVRWPAPEFWRLVTYLFLHGSIWHLLFNLFALWMFGMPVVAQWGDREFVKYFFICGLGAAALQLALSRGSMVPVIGFSGSVFGMLVAFAMLYPDAVVYLYFLIPVKAMHMALLFGALEFFAGATNSTPSIARFAHLGGMITGYVYIRWWFTWKIHAKSFAKGLFEREEAPVRPRAAARRAEPARAERAEGGMDEVDRILDKILASGLESLTDDERELMRRYAQRNKPS